MGISVLPCCRRERAVSLSHHPLVCAPASPVPTLNRAATCNANAAGLQRPADGRFGPCIDLAHNTLGAGLEPSGAFTVGGVIRGNESKSSTMPSGDRSRELRRMAAECLAAARQTFDSGVRASLVELAQRWLDLAERSEHSGWNEALRHRAGRDGPGASNNLWLAAEHTAPSSCPSDAVRRSKRDGLRLYQ
jgi:hypothetical protein